MSALRKSIKEAAVGVHKLCIRMGVHVLPVHYYSPVPNILELKRTKAEWSRPSDLPGIHVDLDTQLKLLSSVCTPYQFEYKGNPHYREGQDKHFGPGYGPIVSKALELNKREGRPGRITSVEPYPSAALRALPDIELLAQPVQRTDLSVFTSLGEGDLLFIDSSHTVRPGGDVNFLVLEVLPRLKPGVIVHIHDIYLPYDYQRDTCETFFHWTETSLVRAYMTHNPKVEILACMSHLHYERAQGMQQVFPDYVPQANDEGLQPEQYSPTSPAPGDFPCSLYLITK